jgi:hypothetical protein
MSDLQHHDFRDLLNSMMKRRWYITALILGTFMLIMAGIYGAIVEQTKVAAEWKELLLLLLGAFIGSYGKIIDYWFSDNDKDKMLVQKMDEEDGSSLSNTNDMKESNHNYGPVIPDAFVQGAAAARDLAKVENVQNFEITKKQQEHEHEMELLHFHHEHRQCEHDWVDVGNGEQECSKCGKIKDPDHHDVTEG